MVGDVAYLKGWTAVLGKKAQRAHNWKMRREARFKKDGVSNTLDTTPMPSFRVTAFCVPLCRMVPPCRLGPPPAPARRPLCVPGLPPPLFCATRPPAFSPEIVRATTRGACAAAAAAADSAMEEQQSLLPMPLPVTSHAAAFAKVEPKRRSLLPPPPPLVVVSSVTPPPGLCKQPAGTCGAACLDAYEVLAHKTAEAVANFVLRSAS